MDPEMSSSLGDSNTKLGMNQSSYPASKKLGSFFVIRILIILNKIYTINYEKL